MRRRLLFWCYLILCRGGCAAVTLSACALLRADQPAETTSNSPTEPPPAAVTPEAVQMRLKEVLDNAELDPQLKMKLIEVYNKALETAQLATDANSRKERFIKQAQDAPATLKSLQREFEKPESPLPLDLPDDATLQQGQQRLTQVESELAAAQKSLKDWQDEPKHRADRRAAIPKQLEDAKAQLQEIDERLDAKPPAEEPPELTAANRLWLQARKQALLAETAAGQAELRLYEAAAEVMPLQRDLAARKVALYEQLAKQLRDLVNDRRRREAEMQARAAELAALEAEPALQEIAERNEELAKHRQALAGRIEIAAREVESVNSRLKTLEEQFSRVQSRVKIAGNNQSIGLLLRKQREELPNVAREVQNTRELAETLSDTSLELIDFQDSRNDLATLDKRLEEVLNGLNVTDEKRTLLQGDVRQMLETQRNLLDAIIADANSYLDKLVELNTREQALIDHTREYAAFCDERIMWIRSAPALHQLPLQDFSQALRWLCDRRGWEAVAQTWWQELVRHPWQHGALLLCWLGFLAWQKRLKKWLIKLGEQSIRGSCRTFRPTAQAVCATILLTVPWPFLLLWIGFPLAQESQPLEFPRALGAALLKLSSVVLGLETLRQVCRHNGLAESHFAWDSRSLKMVRRAVHWSLLIGVPLTLLLLITESQSSESIKNSLGRCAFVCLWAFLIVPAYQTTRLPDGALAPAFQLDPKAWWSQLARVWPVLAVAAPLALIGLAAAGFYYTAVQIAARLLTTIWLIVASVIVYCIFLRWLLTAYRTLGMQRLQIRRAAAEASTTTTPVQANTQLEIKLSDINQQTRQMLRLVLVVCLAVAVWWIWSPIVPALEGARDIQLWTMETPAAPGGEVKQIPITLADLVFSCLVLVMTLALTRNIQNLLELTILSRLPLDAGARYAMSTIARYALMAVGGAAAFTTLGFNWSQVQWLLAAVGVGLGFGLQEIFSNIASGIVLLFEQPIRIGDIVTMGNVEGKVRDIQLRATTLTDWDEREVIIPNKEFISNRIINWTLSNTVSRMSIVIGVAYGTDPDRAKALLLEIAAGHPLVLKDPPPHALLDEFADSTLNLVLRVYMPTRNVYIQLRHELMTRIAARFEEAGIKMAFPQRDVRVRILERPENGETNGQRESSFPKNSAAFE